MKTRNQTPATTTTTQGMTRADDGSPACTTLSLHDVLQNLAEDPGSTLITKTYRCGPVQTFFFLSWTVSITQYMKDVEGS
ncbi:hypothetical protein Q7C36_021529 [Tachysurus vachellii]|uniref:Uncharacterized protein n=1 Tax=Tachysurus vachellii TaxID=175792 RepID=A0AA88ISH1_TACVA|nr:hypothetical protein Q7C36_021529 [Tachysurus vachellii]